MTAASLHTIDRRGGPSGALRRLGLAREIVRGLQEARKNAGLEITDRIDVVYATDDAEVAAAMSQHASTIGEELLAVSLVAGEPAGDAELTDPPLRYALQRA